MDRSLALSLILRVVDRWTGPLGRIGARLSGLGSRLGFDRIGRAASRSADLALSGLRRLGDGGMQIASRLRNAFSGVSAVVSALGGYLTTKFAGDVIETGAAFESYDKTLASLMGSTALGRRALAWVTDFATQTPLQLDEAIEAFIRLKAYGVDPMSGALQALTDQNAQLGKGYESLEGIITAYGQAWAKEKLQTEEILQLIERGVPVWDLLQEVTGKTTAELQDMATAGELGRDVLTRLIDAMARRSGGAALAQMETWNGLVSNGEDAWTGFKRSIADAGFFAWAKSQLKDLMQVFNQMKASGELDQWARRISTAFVEIGEAAKDFILGEKIQADSALSFVRGPNLFERITRGLDDFRAAIEPITGPLSNLEVVLGAVAAIFVAPWVGAIASVAAGLITLTAAIVPLAAALAATPVGWFLLAVAAIGAAAWWVTSNWDDMAAFFEGLWADVEAAWQGMLDWIATSWAAGAVMTGAAAVESAWSGLQSFFERMWNGIKAAFNAAKAEIQAVVDWLQGVIDKLNAGWNTITGLADDAAGWVDRQFDFSGGGGGDTPAPGGPFANGFADSLDDPALMDRLRSDVTITVQAEPNTSVTGVTTSGDEVTVRSGDGSLMQPAY